MSNNLNLYIRFKGILVTTNFGPNNNGPDLSLGQWFGSSSMGLFRTMNSYCGITHRNREPKTGKHSFFFSPLPVGNLKWKRTGFRAIIVVNVNRVHDFYIPGAEWGLLFFINARNVLCLDCNRIIIIHRFPLALCKQLPPYTICNFRWNIRPLIKRNKWIMR